MIIDLQKITVKELTDGFEDKKEAGVKGYGGKLDIRPPYQREFIYDDKDRNAVIDTVTKDYPLNVMYWAVREDGEFEVMDGQQRTISLCQYVTGVFSFNNLYFHNLTDDKQQQILDYGLTVYHCSGTDSEKLEWFKTINIAGKTLTNQELLNAVYSGPWVTDAKRYFSKNLGPAVGVGGNYVNGTANRQDYLEKAIEWISSDKIKEYMSVHQHDANALALWTYFQAVITWVEGTFPKYRKEMKGVDWGTLYNKYKDVVYNTNDLEARILELIDDDDVGSVRGIYPYLLTGDERTLSLRQFDDKTKRKVYERQKGICKKCGKHFEFEGMEADHITPWHEGGKTAEANCQLLCKDDNRRKSGK